MLEIVLMLCYFFILENHRFSELCEALYIFNFTLLAFSFPSCMDRLTDVRKCPYIWGGLYVSVNLEIWFVVFIQTCQTLDTDFRVVVILEKLKLAGLA